MSTFTVCFCGTDCWPDEGMKDRSAIKGSQPLTFGQGGYIPAKIYQDLTVAGQKAIVPGPGKPYFQFWRSLWVPCTVLDPFAKGDTAMGHSLWDLAGHGAARVVGVPSIGRKQADLLDLEDPEIVQLINGVRSRIGAELRPDFARKPPSNDRYQWSPECLRLLLGSAHANLPEGPITKINLIGHSRGGVAAIMCSHELATLFPAAEVNIFAIDPVPGPGNYGTEMTTLGSTVKNYVGVYAVDETSNGFNGVVPRPRNPSDYMDPLERVQSQSQQIKVPNYQLIWSPGRHATVAGNRTSDGKGDPINRSPEVSFIGHLVYLLARACLTRWGSVLGPTGNMTSAHDLKIASKTQKAIDIYRAMREFTYAGTGPIVAPHLKERGISSATGNNPTAWDYLEDYIGNAPLVERPTIRDALHRTQGPSKVKWLPLQDLPDDAFSSTSKNFDRDLEYAGGA